MSTAMIYVTTGSSAEAAKIGRTLVEERLAACANILPVITSIYWWEEKLQEDQEAAMFLKTRQDLVDTVIKRVKELHSYDCPCVVAVSIGAGNEDFITWIKNQTQQ